MQKHRNCIHNLSSLINWNLPTWIKRNMHFFISYFPLSVKIIFWLRATATGCFSNFGGTDNGILGAGIKILRPLFNTNTPLKPPFRHFGNHFGKVIFSHFVLFGQFWSFSRVGGYFFGKVYDFQSQFYLAKRYSFFNIRVPSESSLRVDFK